MRTYIPDDEDPDPADYDEVYDIPAPTARGVAARVFVRLQRDPDAAARLKQRQLEAILDLARWAHQNQEQLRSKGYDI